MGRMLLIKQTLRSLGYDLYTYHEAYTESHDDVLYLPLLDSVRIGVNMSNCAAR